MWVPLLPVATCCRASSSEVIVQSREANEVVSKPNVGQSPSGLSVAFWAISKNGSLYSGMPSRPSNQTLPRRTFVLSLPSMTSVSIEDVPSTKRMAMERRPASSSLATLQ